MELDETDSDIIEALKKDARISYTDLAKELKMSDVAVKKRIDKLISTKVIKNFTINLDYKAIDRPINAFLLLKCIPNESDKIKERIRQSSEIISIMPTIGQYDYIIETATKDVNELRKLAEETIGNIKGVLQVRTIIVV